MAHKTESKIMTNWIHADNWRRMNLHSSELYLHHVQSDPLLVTNGLPATYDNITLAIFVKDVGGVDEEDGKWYTVDSHDDITECVNYWKELDLS